MLDAHQLNVFLIAAETLNFTQAAHRLQMSQPSVSQHIQALEKHFNAKLFFRSGRQIFLTDLGCSLVPLAHEMVSQSILIEETMESIKGDVFGHLLVGCSTTPGKYILPHLLERFHREHTRVKITCEIYSQAQAIQKLCNGDIHIALTSHGIDDCNEAKFHLFMTEKVSLIVPLNHPWSKRLEIDPEELYDADFILREPDSGTYLAVQDALRGVDVHMEDLNTFLTLGNSEAISLAVREGLGVGFVSQTVIDEFVHEGVYLLRIKDLDICRNIYIGHNTRRPATRAKIAFWEFVSNQSLPITGLDYFKCGLPKGI